MNNRDLKYASEHALLAAQSMRDRLDAAEAELDRVRADRDRCLLNANSGYKLANENGRKYGEALSDLLPDA